jgi:enoyl-CoA hydratase/carnithine racemase
MTAAAVSLHRQGDVAVIRLDRPEQRNSLRLVDMRRLDALLEEAAGARCVLLEATGGTFCAGRDLKEMDPATDDAAAVLRDVINPLVLHLARLPVPTVAAVQGAALGLGFGLALACDITLVADDARLGSPFAALGCVLDSGGHYWLASRIGRHRAAELIFAGRMLSGREAAAIGLVNRSVGARDLASAAHALARDIAAGPTAAFRASKTILGLPAIMEEVLAMETAAQGAALASADGQEGMRAFREKRRPLFVGA